MFPTEVFRTTILKIIGIFHEAGVRFHLTGGIVSAVSRELLPGLEIPIVSRSDLAMAKLIWISKGSHKSRADLRKILLRADATETAAVREMAVTQQLGELLEEVLAETEELNE